MQLFLLFLMFYHMFISKHPNKQSFFKAWKWDWFFFLTAPPVVLEESYTEAYSVNKLKRCS